MSLLGTKKQSNFEIYMYVSNSHSTYMYTYLHVSKLILPLPDINNEACEQAL